MCTDRLCKKQQLASIGRDIELRQAEAVRIGEDQHRLRENIAALKGASGESQLLKRYLTQLNQQEDRLALLRQETAVLEERRGRASDELSALIETLTFDVDVVDAADAANGATPATTD